MKEIKVEEVRMMPRDSYELIDIRDVYYIEQNVFGLEYHRFTREDDE